MTPSLRRISSNTDFASVVVLLSCAVLQCVKWPFHRIDVLQYVPTLSGLLPALLHLAASGCRFGVEARCFIMHEIEFSDRLMVCHLKHREAHDFGSS